MRFFQVGVIALFIAALFDSPKRKIKGITLPIAFLLIMVLVNSFWHMFQPLDTRIVEDLFFAILGIIIISNYLKDLEGCYSYIYAAIIINIVVLLFQKIGYSPIMGYEPGTHGGIVGLYEGGIMGNSSRLAMYIALSAPFVWSFSVSLFFVLVLSVLLIGEHNTLITLGVFLIFKAKGRHKIWTSLMTIGTFLIFRKHFVESILFRWENVWKEGLELILKRPLLGYGFGNYYLLYGREPFNSYLPFIFGLGIAGLAWIVYVVYKFRRDLVKSTEGLAVVTLLILCLYEYIIETPRLWFTIIFIIAAFLIKKGGSCESDLQGPIASISNGI